ISPLPAPVGLCGGRAPGGGPTRGSTWPEYNSHSPTPIPAIALMASSSGRPRKLYNCTPIRTPLTLLFIFAAPCAHATVIGRPTRASLPKSLLEYILCSSVYILQFLMIRFGKLEPINILAAGAMAPHCVESVAGFERTSL